MNFLSRSELLVGKNGIKKLNQSHVMIIGLGGVGSYAAEAIARAGVGIMTIVDGDTVQESNINRQLPALYSQINRSKVEIMAERIRDINPNIQLHVINQFLMPEDIEKVIPSNLTFLMDCIDSITPKIMVITYCKRNKIKFISSMGAGGKTDPAKIKIVDINETRDCFFSRDIRKRLRSMKYNYGIKVVYSDEVVDKSAMALSPDTLYKKSFYGTISYMPAMFGLTMASYVIRKIIAKKEL
jgi:tRNA A37 threonylcarbamoyladenosine dehydratase